MRIWYESEHGRFVQIIRFSKTYLKYEKSSSDMTMSTVITFIFHFNSIQRILHEHHDKEKSKITNQDINHILEVNTLHVHQYRVPLNEHQDQTKRSFRNTHSRIDTTILFSLIYYRIWKSIIKNL